MTRKSKIPMVPFVNNVVDPKLTRKGYAVMIGFSVMAKGRARFQDIVITRDQAVAIRDGINRALK